MVLIIQFKAQVNFVQNMNRLIAIYHFRKSSRSTINDKLII